MPQQFPTLDDINAAALRIEGLVHKTPLLTCDTINELFKAEIYFKCENFQKAGAFKSRGACNAVFSLEKEELINGVGTHSSGNHAQALARAARLREADAYIVMPETAQKVKIDAVKQYGGKISFCKPTLESRESTLKSVLHKTGALEIHPYNDYRIIAGQGTAALEILGYRHEELIGKKVHSLIHSKHKDGSEYPIEDYADAGEVVPLAKWIEVGVKPTPVTA